MAHIHRRDGISSPAFERGVWKNLLKKFWWPAFHVCIVLYCTDAIPCKATSNVATSREPSPPVRTRRLAFILLLHLVSCVDNITGH